MKTLIKAPNTVRGDMLTGTARTNSADALVQDSVLVRSDVISSPSVVTILRALHNAHHTAAGPTKGR